MIERYLLIIMFSFLSICGFSQTIFNNNAIGNAIILPEDEINTSSFEYSPVFYGEFIAFVYDKGNSTSYDEVYNTPYFDLAFAAKNTLGNLAKKASFGEKLSSELQEGPFCFYNGGKTILYTRTDPITGLLRIYISEMIDSEWSQGTALLLSDEDLHNCHPSVSADGKTMVFAMASETAPADMDLYIAELSGSKWGNIERLREGINSKANDWFPRFLGDSIIVFSSEREGGFGGLDIYATKKINDKWSLPELGPIPINSPKDDIGLIVGKEICYFSSDRNGTKGKDDLYRMEFKGDLFYDVTESMVPLIINVKDKLTLRPINDVSVSIIPIAISLKDVNLSEYQIDLIPQEGGQGEILLKLKPKGTDPSDVGLTDSMGTAQLKIRKSKSYLIELSGSGYASYTTLYNIESMGNEITLVMEPHETSSEGGLIIPTTTGSVIVFEHIYYDFNSHVILEGAGQELDALVTTMVQNPNMLVQLSAHTDSRGTRLYNQRLSEKRAASARDYLIRKGITPSRITTLGYGESQLRNHCDDNTSCTEEEHSFNRRTEVKVLSN